MRSGWSKRQAYIESRSARSPIRSRLDSTFAACRLRTRSSSSSLGPSVGEPVDLGEERRLQRLVPDAGPGGDPHREDRRAADEREGEDGHVLRDLLLADQGPIQARGASGAEQVDRDLERVEAIGPEGGHPVGGVDARQRDAVRDDLAHLGADDRVDRASTAPGGMAGLAGIGPKYFSTSASAAGGSKSPAIVSTALFGA